MFYIKISLKKPISRFQLAITSQTLITSVFPRIGFLKIKQIFPDLQHKIPIHFL